MVYEKNREALNRAEARLGYDEQEVTQHPSRKKLEDRLDNQRFIREFPGLQFGIKFPSVLIDFEAPIVEGDQLKGGNPLLPRAENFLRQTDGSWFVISLCAIFNFQFHTHRHH